MFVVVLTVPPRPPNKGAYRHQYHGVARDRPAHPTKGRTVTNTMGWQGTSPPTRQRGELSPMPGGGKGPPRPLKGACLTYNKEAYRQGVASKGAFRH